MNYFKNINYKKIKFFYRDFDTYDVFWYKHFINNKNNFFYGRTNNFLNSEKFVEYF